MKIAGYRIREELYRGQHVSVYRATKEDGTGSRILKVLEKRAAPPSAVLHAIKREHRFLQQIDSPFVIKVIDWLEQKDFAILVLEDIHGKPLKEEIRERPLAPERFIALAVGLSSGLAAIHRQNIIHRDINPSNMLLGPSPGSLKIIDFNIASKFDVKVPYSGNPERLQGTLPYISPEQTGRMNRRVDHRSDLYSLGVTFYEMATGRLPFLLRSPIEIVYDHLARDPEPPNLVNKQVPGILAKIILKLLAKDPEERYQSAQGLKHDLESFRDDGPLDFKLGERDFSGKLQIPEKLYGRETEIRQLLAAYQAVSQGAKKFILVTGYAGTGKSALVNEIHKPITRDRGYFVSGKFDQLQRATPYFAFIQAINQFCQYLLTGNQDVLAQWRESILQAVGKLGKVLTDAIPPLETVIGLQPEVPETSGMEAKKRFNHVFQGFLQAISSEEHPLVIFIDDMQWADLASLNLLHVLMEGKQPPYLLFIGAYRNSEVSPTHPLMITLEEIQKQGTPLETITVKNLSIPHIGEWLQDTLKTGSDTGLEQVGLLTELICRKTGGNAFFTLRFLENLYRENWLRFDFSQSQWTWNLGEIQRQNITDNVVELLVHKIQTLPAEAQEVLKLAACIGHVFDLETLAVISRQGEEELERSLEIALLEHLVYPLDNAVYQFIHDRIHQAVYTLISAEEKKPLHLAIGRLLLKRFQVPGFADVAAVSTGGERKIFDIVNHLNIGIQQVEREEEKIQLARLNLEAGQKARTATAYREGADYVQTARGLLPPDSWQRYYELTLAIYNEALQASYLCGDFEEMECLTEAVLAAACSIPDSAVAYEYRLRGLLSQKQPRRAVETLLTIFNSLGVKIPGKPGQLKFTRLLRKTHALLKRKGVESLRDLPLMRDPRKQLAIKLFYMGGVSLAHAAQELMFYLVTTCIGFILEEGLTPESPYVLSVYGGKRVYLGDLSGAYRIAEITMDLLERGIGNEAVRVNAVSILGFSILGNKQHFKHVCQLLLETYQYALDLGKFDHASHILANYLLFLGRTDTQVTLLHEKARTIHDTILQLKQPIIISPILAEMALSANLLGEHANPAVLDLDLGPFLQNLPVDSQRVFLCQINIKRIILAYLFEEYSPLLEYIKAVEDAWKQITSPFTFMKSDIYFYIPLAYLQLASITASKADKKRYLGKVKKSIREMKKWAEFGPVNFLHKYYLMQAEAYRVSGKTGPAAEYYDKAIETAYENEYLNEAALANELAAKFYLRSHQVKLASFYFNEARACYRQWGAKAKVKHLEEKYPKYLCPGIAGSILDTGTLSLLSSEGSSEALDVKSILKASQTLSGEVQLKSLLEKMMQILLENAGAQRGFFIQPMGQRLLLQAEGDSEGVSGILSAQPLEESGKLPLSLINYVNRSRKRLVFDNLAKAPHYATDYYIQTHQPKSVVCFPVLSKGEISAIIYLENNRVEGAFTPARLEVLNMLSAQIAISVENTNLVEHLEEKVKQRTLALQQAKEELERNHQALAESHRKINDSVNCASRIQEAVLPARDSLALLLPQHFVFYRPCAVVSGDFYWVKLVNHKIVVAAADCTGHGVPGALVSMLGTAFLNEIIPQLAAQSQLKAGIILDELRNKVKIALKQSGKLSEQKEGMDIALCIIDPLNHQFQYAGAYSPLFFIRENRLVEVKADRMPIGIYYKERPFITHDLPLQDDTMIYLFSDGFISQNSEKGIETFSKKSFKRLLLEIHKEPVSRQKELLIRRFDQWKGNVAQRDDVLILGIRF